MNLPSSPGSDPKLKYIGKPTLDRLRTVSLDDAVRVIEATAPQVWKRLYTKCYSPNWIGRKYEIIRKEHAQSAGVQGHYTELGWRAGHIKRQHYGKRNEQEKLILIDPYIAFTRGYKPQSEV